MNSTDPALSSASSSFFLERLLPLARRLRAEKGALLPLGPEAGAGSYFLKRSRTTMAPAEFELPRLNAAASLAEALAELWRRRGRPELAPLAAEMAGWVESLRQTDPQSGEVSPFIYVMY